MNTVNPAIAPGGQVQKVSLLRVLGPAHVWALVAPYGLKPTADELPREPR